MTRDWGENARSEKTCGEVDRRQRNGSSMRRARSWRSHAGEQLGQVCVQGTGEGDRFAARRGGKGGQDCWPLCCEESRAGVPPAQVLAGQESLGGESFRAGMEQCQGRGWAGGGPVGPTGRA